MQEVVTYNDFYEVREIAKGVYDIDEARLATMYLVLGEERALVIDCGIGIADFKSVIDKLTDLPYDVVISHSHVDHIGGREQFDKLYLHKDDVEIIPKVTLRYRKFYRRAFITKSKRFKKYLIKDVEKEPEIIPIEDGHIFHLGKRTVKVIHTPGHTLGAITFLIEEDGILLTNDNFNPILLLFLPHADTVENYIKSGEKILAMENINLYWGSHLRKPNTREDIENTVNNARDIIAKWEKNTRRYSFRIKKKNNSIIAYRSDNIFNK